MVRYIALALLFLGMGMTQLFSQTDEKTRIYDPMADASAQIDSVVAKAASEGKHVLLQIGGNWCVWCIRFHHYVQSDSSLSAFLEENYVPLKVNYSRENQNPEVLARLGFPQRFGFPVFVVLDEKGNRLHTQDSGYLESGNGYDKNKVGLFFKNWSPGALSPEKYR